MYLYRMKHYRDAWHPKQEHVRCNTTCCNMCTKQGFKPYPAQQQHTLKQKAPTLHMTSLE